MANISSISNFDYSQHKQAKLNKDEANLVKPEQKKKEEVQDVLDKQLEKSIKKENIIAAEQDISSAEQAAEILNGILDNLSTSPTAEKMHANFDTARINALINN